MIASSLIRGTLVGLTALGLTAGTVAFAQGAGSPAKSADFSVKATPQGPITEGDGVTVVLVAKNDGSQEIGGAMFRARLPDGFTYVKGSTQGATHADPHVDAKGQLMWDARDTKPGEATRLTFRMKAGPDSQGNNRCVQGFYWFNKGIRDYADKDCFKVVNKQKPEEPKATPTPKPEKSPKPEVTPKPSPKPCPDGFHRPPHGVNCLQDKVVTPCPVGFHRPPHGVNCLEDKKPLPACPAGFHRPPHGVNCLQDAKPLKACPVGFHRPPHGVNCLQDKKPTPKTRPVPVVVTPPAPVVVVTPPAAPQTQSQNQEQNQEQSQSQTQSMVQETNVSVSNNNSNTNNITIDLDP